MNARELRELLDKTPDDAKIVIHVDWDWPIEETDFDGDDQEFALFPAIPDNMRLVDKKRIRDSSSDLRNDG